MLTPKQEKFVMNIIDGMSQADAYRNSYDVKKMSDKTVWEKASRLMSDDKVRARLQELRDQMMKPSIMSAQERLEYLTRVIKGEELEETYEWDDGERITCNTPASIRTRLQAMDLMNKMQGVYTTKIEGSIDTSLNKLEGILEQLKK